MLPEGLPHQQPENDYDAHHDEQVYKRIVIRHCRIISFTPRCQTTHQRLGRFQHEHEAIEKGADQAAAAYPQIAAARGGYRRRKSWAKSRLSRCKQDWEAFASRPDVAGLRPHITGRYIDRE